jgi:Flp pilus assembly protein TadD
MTNAIAVILAAMMAAAPLGEIDHAIDAGRVGQARIMIAKAFQDGSSEADMAPLQAKLAFRAGAYEEALARYEILLAAQPADSHLNERVGLAALSLGRDERALSALAIATASPGATWRAWNALGVLADRARDFVEARSAYAKAQALAPTRAEIINNIGWSYLLEGRASDALPYLERAAGTDPQSRLFAANAELARAAIAQDLPARRAGEKDEAYAARLNDLGVVALSQQQKRKAIAAFSQAIDVRGDYYQRAANNLNLAEGEK